MVEKKGLKVEDYFLSKEEIIRFKEMFEKLPKPKL